MRKVIAFNIDFEQLAKDTTNTINEELIQTAKLRQSEEEEKRRILREKDIERLVNYWKAHPAELKACRKKYFLEHRELFREYSRKWYQNHKELIKIYKQTYAEKHRDKINEYKRKYYQEHREEILQKIHIKRQLKKSNNEVVKNDTKI